jgi:hypothetical protein
MLEKDSHIITGCARSGAGMIAGLIHLCGAFGGEMSNKKGYMRMTAYVIIL